jgi:hypothetical protein
MGWELPFVQARAAGRRPAAFCRTGCNFDRTARLRAATLASAQKVQLTTVVPLIFGDLAASRASMTRTMSASDQSVSDTPAAIAGVTRRL